jgi:hypothetical protein
LCVEYWSGQYLQPISHVALRSKSKDWLAWNQDKWNDMSTLILLFQWRSIIKIQLRNAVDCGCKPQSSWMINWYLLLLIYKHAVLMSRNNDWLARNQDNVSKLPTDYCSSDLALWKCNLDQKKIYVCLL